MKKHSSPNKIEMLRLKFYKMSKYVDFISHNREKAFMSCLTEYTHAIKSGFSHDFSNESSSWEVKVYSKKFF